ncbi:palmitoyl-protein thioesterase 1-like [Xylocopa sonorina]|uniref:palmitoyl-protein thioesterase 1-like n=1 Tax=Xylocopa sonorina TaxID=1818115 RepID=UPI00403AAC9C
MFTSDKRVLLLFLVCVYKSDGVESNPTPVVLWHGMGDSCCFSFSMGKIKKLIETLIPNIHVHSIELGSNLLEDVERSYFGNVNDHIQDACQQLANDEKLKDGYNIIGFSQGGQLARAIAQRCPNPPIKYMISIGGPQQGVFGLPNCGSIGPTICKYMNRILHYAAYLQYSQENLVQATFWHDPYREEEYREKSIFMAELNNENYINETYRENLQKLEAMVLIKFLNDTVVWPQESEWFGFYKPGQVEVIQPFNETRLYEEDRLGLRKLYESGKLHFIAVPGDHLQFTEDWFIEKIVKVYLM